jgi:hypothetical protein
MHACTEIPTHFYVCLFGDCFAAGGVCILHIHIHTCIWYMYVHIHGSVHQNYVSWTLFLHTHQGIHVCIQVTKAEMSSNRYSTRCAAAVYVCVSYIIAWTKHRQTYRGSLLITKLAGLQDSNTHTHTWTHIWALHPSGLQLCIARDYLHTNISYIYIYIYICIHIHMQLTWSRTWRNYTFDKPSFLLCSCRRLLRRHLPARYICVCVCVCTCV